MAKRLKKKNQHSKLEFNLQSYFIIFVVFIFILLFTYIYKKYLENEKVIVGSHIQGANTKISGPINKIENALDDYTNKDLFSGAVLIAKDGEILLRKGYGYSNRELKYKNSPDTRFRLGSLTKAFTAMGIMILYDRDYLDVNDPVSKYIPDFKNGKNIKIQHLLTHQSGIPNYFFGYTKASSPVTTKDLVDLINKQSQSFKAGEKFEYSNSNYVLLTYIIESVSKTSYENFLKINIFDPLKMKDSGYDTNTDNPKYARGYTLKNGTVVDADYVDMTFASGTGGLFSTIDDMYKWDQALYTYRIVNKDVMEKIFKPEKVGYAYGWNIKLFNLDDKTTKLIWHEGLISGFTSYIYRYTDENLTIIILKNMEPNKLDPGDLINKTYWGQKYKLGENEWFLDFN